MLGTLAELVLRSNPMILHALRGTYAFVFLDEFQDTTGIQYRLLHTAFHGSAAVLTAVGDHKQRIMLWAGALEGVFDVFRREFNAQLRGLEMNYRSAPRLVQIQRYLVESLDPNSAMPRAIERNNGEEGECRLLVFPNDDVEADSLSTLINSWINEGGVAPKEYLHSRSETRRQVFRTIARGFGKAPNNEPSRRRTPGSPYRAGHASGMCIRAISKSDAACTKLDLYHGCSA